MKHKSYTHNQTTYIKITENELNTKSLTVDSSYPMINGQANSVILDLEQIQNIDATGLSWLVEFGQKLQKIGSQIYISEACTAYQTIMFLGLEDVLPSAKNFNHKQAI